MSRLLLALAALLACACCAAAPWPTVEAIRYAGNDITREQVISRELRIAVGEAADPARIEDSRQAILDLGLFREIEIESAPGTRGGVVLTVRVREKRYLLPIPRLDASADKDYSYGAQLRWSNIAGLNHRLNLTFDNGRYPNDSQRERERELSLSYAAPYVFGSDWAASARIERVERVTPGAAGRYDERFARFEALAIRDFTHGRPRQGWRLGGGVLLEDQTTDGEFAPPADGRALALVGIANYDDVRFHVYSETGRRLRIRAQGAFDEVGSDYGYARLQADYFESRAWGSRDHQTLHALAQWGHRSGGPNSRDEFSLGGSSRLRGYDSDALQGDRYYYGAFEMLKPLGRDWLRGVVMLEVGGIEADRAGLRDGSPHASIGVGLRARLTWFVDIELEAGIAYPLRGGGGARVFAGTN